MATAPARAQWAVDDLLAAIKHLPPAEFHEFQRQFAAWAGQNNGLNGVSYPEREEETLLAAIRENSSLSAAAQRRFNRLRRKQQDGTLTTSEEQQLQDLWRQAEQMSGVRLESLAELARRRGTDVRTLMRQLGLPENRNVF